MHYEVLIAGGHAAGSSLALPLARLGHRVLVVDRDEFPSDTLSTHLMNPTAVGRPGTSQHFSVTPTANDLGFRVIR